MTNDKPKWDVEFCRCLPNHGRCKYCLTFKETPKPITSEPKCEHDRITYWISPSIARRVEKSDEKECPFCKPQLVTPEQLRNGAALIALDYIKEQINDKTGLYGPKP